MNTDYGWGSADTKPLANSKIDIEFEDSKMLFNASSDDYEWDDANLFIKRWRYSITPDEYAILKQILDEAYNQAAKGKGKERHGNGLPFEEQPMQSISNLLHSHKGCLFQAIKKIQESTGLEYEHARKELLGAINYVAGAIIYLDKQEDDR